MICDHRNVIANSAVRKFQKVFDNGDDLVVAQAQADFPDEAIEPTLQQLAGNVRPGGRNSTEVTVRLRQLQPAGEGASRSVVLGETVRDFLAE